MTKDLTYSLEVLGVTRNNVINLIDQIPYEQLIVVPQGYNNSIIWNAVHNLTTQQLLCYKLSGLKLRVPDLFVSGFVKGDKGDQIISKSQLDDFKEVYRDSIEILRSDYNSGEFKSFTEYTTSYNITLKSIEDVINFNNTHEGLHLGYMMALKKLV